MKYNKNTFEQGNNTILADEVEEGMILLLSFNRYFYVDEIDKFYINDDIAKLYGDDDDIILPEHTKIRFYSDAGDKIFDVPGTAPVIAYRMVEGKHSNIDEVDERERMEAAQRVAAQWVKEGRITPTNKG